MSITKSYTCDICGLVGTDEESMRKHSEIPFKEYGFQGGEVFSYGKVGSGCMNISVVLKPVDISHEHAEIYQCVCLPVMSESMGNESYVEESYILWPYFPPEKPCQDETGFRLAFPRTFKVEELTQDEFVSVEKAIKRKKRRFLFKGDMWDTAFPNESVSANPEHDYSYHDLINHYYPIITELSIGRLPNDKDLFYEFRT